MGWGGQAGRDSVSSILLSCWIWFSAIKKGDIEECFSFHHFAVGNCFPHSPLGFDVSPAAVTKVTARAVPVQMCYLSVSLLTLWLNRSSCGQRAISALYHTVWNLMESFYIFSWKNFLPWMEVLKKFIFCVLQKNALRNNSPFHSRHKPDTISASSMTPTPQHA